MLTPRGGGSFSDGSSQEIRETRHIVTAKEVACRCAFTVTPWQSPFGDSTRVTHGQLNNTLPLVDSPSRKDCAEHSLLFVHTFRSGPFSIAACATHVSVSAPAQPPFISGTAVTTARSLSTPTRRDSVRSAHSYVHIPDGLVVTTANNVSVAAPELLVNPRRNALMTRHTGGLPHGSPQTNSRSESDSGMQRAFTGGRRDLELSQR
jgi:hypothetical protein